MNITKQEQLIKRLETERKHFKRDIMNLPKNEIYDHACEIAVKEDIKGYIESEVLPSEYTERLLLCENILDALYMASLEMDISNSGDISTLLLYVCKDVSDNVSKSNQEDGEFSNEEEYEQ